MNFKTLIIALLLLSVFEALFAENRTLLYKSAIEGEMRSIREYFADLRLYKQTGEAIRDGKCSGYWTTYQTELKAFKEALNPFYKEARRKDALSNLNLYKECFTTELVQNWPSITHHELDPSSNYQEFKATYKKFQEKAKNERMQARFSELGQMLKNHQYRE